MTELYEATKGNIRVCLGGDAMLTRRLAPHAEPAFLGVRDLLSGADLSIANAEMLFHDYEPAPTYVPGGSYMRAAPEMIDELRWLGISAVSTANNHSYDYGERGIITNLDNLRRHDMACAGTGLTLEDARSARYLDLGAGRVALIGVTLSGPQIMMAAHQWRDGTGRPGANMLRYYTEITVEDRAFEVLRKTRDDLGLQGHATGKSAYRFSDHSYGASSIEETADAFYLSSLNGKWQYPAPNGCVIRRGGQASSRLVPHQDDLDEILLHVGNAARMADWVIVSVHSHESGDSGDEASSLLVEFAHSLVRGGADIVHCHGPHTDRGIEIYEGRPIFYSVGHLAVQNDTISRLPLDSYVRQGLDPLRARPADFFDARGGRESDGEFLGKAAEEAYWRSFIPEIQFGDGQLVGIRLHPIDFGYKLPRYQRGRPVIAEQGTADRVIDRLVTLSEPFGTKIQRDGMNARVVVL